MGKEAESVLEQMDEQYRLGQNQLKPDVLTFTNVIHCIALSGNEKNYKKSIQRRVGKIL